MDREKELAHLMHVEKALARADWHIADQERRVAHLDRDGHGTKRTSAAGTVSQVAS